MKMFATFSAALSGLKPLLGRSRASKFLAKGCQHLLVLAVEAARQNYVVQARFPVVGEGLDDLVL